MTDSDKIVRVQVLLGEDVRATSSVVTSYIGIAQDTVLNTLYPFGIPETVTSVPTQYEGLQCELAARYFARQGGLGETVHLENGVHRHWDSPDDVDLLCKIIPYGKVL